MSLSRSASCSYSLCSLDDRYSRINSSVNKKAAPSMTLVMRTSTISMHAMRPRIAEASGGNAPALDSRVVSAALTPAQVLELLLGAVSTTVGGSEVGEMASCCAGAGDADVTLIDSGGGTEPGRELGAEAGRLASPSPIASNFFDLALRRENCLRKLMNSSYTV
jgi:hypothetical protein